jgi:cyclopropane-fatty-acyl-phospholipid synthase
MAVDQRRLSDLHRAMGRLLSDDDWALVAWDGSRTGPDDGAFTVSLHDRSALDRMIGSLADGGFGRAFIEGSLEVTPLEPFLDLTGRTSPGRLVRTWPGVLLAAARLGARPRPRALAAAEARLRGRRHSRRRDADAIRHHYDLPEAFYQLWLDSTLSYSCAYFASEDDDLDTAQRAKLELVCRKLRLRPDEDLLDVGCGFGGLVIHAAIHHGVQATGITLSPTQARVARERIREAGLEDRVTVELADYRDPMGKTFDAVASVGMVEHVGERALPGFCRVLHDRLRPGGRVLLHGITAAPGQSLVRGSFVDRFVFPDGELLPVATVLGRMEDAALEVRDVEDLREHYTLTLGHWVRRLRARRDAAVAIAGPERTRVWELYMAGAASGFRENRFRLHQFLAVRALPDGRSGLPLRREDWYR